MNPVAEDILMHVGTPQMYDFDKHGSGRYRQGSGKNPHQHSGDFVSRVQKLKKQGFSEKDIVKELGFDSTTDYRYAYSIAKNERRGFEVSRAKSLKADGYNTSEIARMMGKNESSVRSLLNKTAEDNMNKAEKTADILKKELKEKHMLDVGAGVERELGVSRQKLNEALRILEDEGYNVYGVGIPQVNNPGKQTNTKVLCDPDIPYSHPYKHMGDIQSVGEYHSTDGGVRWDKREYPASIKSDRVKIRYGDEGGVDKDGVIEIRRGVPDLDLGKSHYAQVRIMVDGTHYLKGMAMYSDDIPDGVDIVFNTNKKTGTPKMEVMKKIKDDPDNPFGAYIKAGGQSKYIGKDGKEHLSAINKLKEEGDWDTMSRNLSSQFLSKQPMRLIKQQLKLTYSDHEAKYDEIMSLTNPTVKKKMLLDFADSCDSAVVHLKAAALPRQETRVILPLTKIKDNEIYAPYLKNGEKVVLIRYPHGGTFEIPELTVNNKNPSAKKILGNVIDAVGINSKVAERLSGADFDGDTVVVIPVNSKVRVKSTPPLDGLKGFDPKDEYGTTKRIENGKEVYYNAAGIKIKPMSDKNKPNEMGRVSNLITDMTLRGAPEADIARAVRHSMVVVDAAKHHLDYKQSEKDNGIAELKKKYQVKYDTDGNPIGSGGASTLISRHKATVRVPERRGAAMIDPDTGEVSYKESGRTYIDKKGKKVEATNNVYLLNNVKDVRSISSGTPQEDAYAAYANKVKALANRARKEYMHTDGVKRNANAAVTYRAEVDSLNAKLNVAAKDAPRQRRAQALANSVVKAKIQDNPELADKSNKDALNKVNRIALEDARQSVGASSKNSRIDITDKEWEAIQMGAISHTKLTQILRYADPDRVKELAMPKTTTKLSTAKVSKVKQMQASGYTIAQIAESLGVSTSTVSKYLNN